MKKIVLMLGLWIGYLSTAQGQLGIQAGIDFSQLTTDDYKIQTGLHIGATYEFSFAGDMFLETGLLFYSGGTRYEEAVSEGAREVVKHDVDMYGVETPILLSYRPHLSRKAKLVLEAGGYLGCGLFGKTDVLIPGRQIGGIIETEEKNTFDSGYRRFNAGLQVGIGASYFNYFLKLISQFGVTEAVKENTEPKHQNIRVALGYKF